MELTFASEELTTTYYEQKLRMLITETVRYHCRRIEKSHRDSKQHAFLTSVLFYCFTNSMDFVSHQ